MQVTAKQLKAIAPEIGSAVIDHFLPHLNAAMAEFNIASVNAVSHFLGQLIPETNMLSKMSEDLFYSTPGRLMIVWPSRFKSLNEELPYLRNPEKLANFVYAGRMGNGMPESGDGWRYRGAGAFQLTGKTNHLLCAKHFNILPAKIGDWLRSPEGAMRSAAWFFTKSGAIAQAELNNCDKCSDIVNLGKKTEKIGDAIGYSKRLKYTNAALKVLS